MQRKVASNLVWMLVERGLQVGAGIGIVAMLARGLGPEGFAHFQYAQAIVLIAASVGLICGAEVIVPRLVAMNSVWEQHKLLAHALSLRVMGAALGYLLMCVFLLITRPPPATWITALLLGVSILLRESSGVVVAWMQAHTNNRPSTLFNLFSLTAKVSLVAILFALGQHAAPVFAGAFAVEPIILALLLGSHYLSRVSFRKVALEAPLTRELFSGGAMFWASFMLMMGARRVDQLILQPSVALAEFSAYAATMQILDNYTAVATILAASVAPTYVYSKINFAAARTNVARIALGMGLAGLAGALTIALGAHWIIHLLYGKEFASSVALLQFAALASTLLFVDVGLTLQQVYLRRPDWIAMKWALVLVVTVTFDAVAVPRYGVWGAIGGYALSNAVAVTFGLYLWWRSRRSPQVRAA
ncbi:lipopolysaccharide biosynthesis protein [Cupriavidus basilensis]|uniref:lipopolysaccharide biosynthesis protein n=1 Tax=Cupriavidus basilensis TaxID=68895 RepID=UPI0023E8F58E|nr:oligosaccharide flippase family protein [Cupriavidus basilensis]MDF3886532.1 oligosaccharide flippase family protein [Cupriavidus basilensis]